MEIATAPDSTVSATICSQTKTRAERESDAMSAEQIVHSNYVPAQLHRHLQFLDFNSGKYII